MLSINRRNKILVYPFPKFIFSFSSGFPCFHYLHRRISNHQDRVAVGRSKLWRHHKSDGREIIFTLVGVVICKCCFGVRKHTYIIYIYIHRQIPIWRYLFVFAVVISKTHPRRIKQTSVQYVTSGLLQTAEII